MQPPEVLASYLGYDRRLLLLGVAVTVLSGIVIFGRLGLRSGGFIAAAYVAFILPRWLDQLFFVGVAFITWLVVARLLMPRLLIFGRRKLSTMILIGALFGWTAELASQWLTDGLWQPGRGLAVMTLMVPALIANDAQRQGWERTAWGLSLGTAAVIGITNLVAAILLATGLMSPAASGVASEATSGSASSCPGEAGDVFDQQSHVVLGVCR